MFPNATFLTNYVSVKPSGIFAGDSKQEVTTCTKEGKSSSHILMATAQLLILWVKYSSQRDSSLLHSALKDRVVHAYLDMSLVIKKI